MKKYQDILRDQTSRNLAAKKVNTSMLMLPLRLESKIMYRRVDKTDEPEKVLYAFQALHRLLQNYHRLASLKNPTEIEEATRRLKQQMSETIHCFETIDLLYAEDKSYLTDLVTNIHHSLHTVELQDAFAPLIDTLDDIPRLTSHSDKSATNYLNELDRITRLLENMVNCPLFTGRRRDGKFATYSQTARFRYAYKRYKEINSWFDPSGKGRKITAMANSIRSGMITKSQCIKFDNLIQRIKKAITFAPLSDNNHWGKVQAHINLIKGYPYEHNINPEDNQLAYGVRLVEDETYEKCLEEFHVSLYPNNPVAGRNKYFHYNRMIKMAKLLYDNLTSFINNDFEGIKTILDAKVRKHDGKKKPCSIRYTLIVSKMLQAELLLAKAAHAKNRRMRRPCLRAAYNCQSSVNSSITDYIYFTYGVQRRFVIDLINDIDHLPNNRSRDSLSSARAAIVKYMANGEVSLKKTKKRKCLCLRIYPDVVALTQAVRQISREEYLAGKDFWLKYIFNDDEKYRQSLWLAICDLFPAHRSAFILKSTFPKATYGVMCRKAREFHDNNMTIDDFIKEIDENFVNSFPTTYVDNGEQLFTVPVTNLLPDRFVVHAAVKTKVNASRTIIQYGHRLPRQLQVGIDLNNLDAAIQEKKVDQKGRMQLYLNGGLSWMTDYDEAERLGMAITIPLDAMKTGLNNTKDRNFEFNQIIVYGVNEANSYESNKMIKDLMTGNLYSDKAMDIISFETASNIITNEDAKYAFDSSEGKQRERFQYQAYNCVHPHVPERGNDLDILDRLLCLNESVLGNIDEPGKPGQAEVELQRRVNRLMIDYLTKDSLGSVINPLLNKIKNSPTLYDYLCNDVLPRGPFPMLRIGDQPYGILPACDLRNLAVSVSNPLAIVKKILLVLTTHWNNILSTNIVTCYGKDSDNSNTTVTTNDYLDILGNTPRSTSFYRRKMVKSGIIDAQYFRGETYHHQIEELMTIAKSLQLIGNDEDSSTIKSIIPNYDYVPLKIKDPNASDEAYFYIKDALDIDNIVDYIRRKLILQENKNPTGIQFTDDMNIIRNYVIEFFDLFNYRLDAWLMGILNNKIRTRMNLGKHRLALGCFGWLFNLKEVDDYKLGCTNEYIVAPSINQAITGAILRSSYNNSVKNGKAHNYDMGVNLSSERVRSAIRIIEGIQNGLSLGCILGADMERLIHEAWKTKPELELDSCIYPLRIVYPLMKNDQPDANNADDGSPANITVLNGARLLEDYTARKEAGKDAIKAWLKNDLNLFAGNAKLDEKIEELINIIDIIDDEKDALTDVVLSESVYKLTQGNTEASAAISRALKELKNIPMPEVTEIPISSAQIDNFMIAMLPAGVANDQQDNLLAYIEPKVDVWLRQMMHHPDNIYMRPQLIQESPLSLGSLGISASEMVYLSADKTSFTHFVEVLAWMKTGTFRKFVDCDSSFAMKGADKHAFSECAMAIDELRNVLAAARPLTNDDLVKQTGLPSSAVYSEISDEYHHVEGYMARLLADIQQLSKRQQEIQNPENPDYGMLALPDDMVAEAVRILLNCYRIGYTMALDAVDKNIFIGQRDAIDGVVEWKETVQAQHALFQSMQILSDNMQAILAEAGKIIANDADRKHTTYIEALKTVLVSCYLVVPSFRPDENVPIADLAGQAAGNRFENIDRMELEAMMGDLAQVEQPMMNLHQLRLFQKCDDIDAPGIVPMQLASVENNIEVKQWLGTTVASEDDVRDAFTYIVMSPEQFVEASSEQEPLLAGIVIDHWIERIPYRDQTAAVAFGYDQPDAEAPQTLLLAVATKDNNKGWNEKMLVNSIKSAIHMVKCRTVSPDLLSKDGWASGLFPLLEYKDPRKSQDN